MKKYVKWKDAGKFLIQAEEAARDMRLKREQALT